MMRLTNIKRLDAEVSYPLFVSLGGETRLFNLGKIAFTLNFNNKLNTNMVYCRTNLCNLGQWVVARIPLYFNLLCLSSNITKRISILRRKTQKKATARALRNVRTTLRGLENTLHGLISRVFNTDSLHISHNWGSVSSFAPLPPF